ncbi:MAG: hypothetical protein Q4G65_01920 [bacterium]|nr:hypothetical protein [bacterium]
MKNYLILIGLVLAVAGWFLLGMSDERRVRKTFATAESALCKEGNESPFKMLGAARTLAELVEPGCRLEIPERKFSVKLDGGDLAQQIAGFRRQSTAFTVSFEDLNVVFPDKTTAQVSCDFFFRGDSDALGLIAGRDARALDATLHWDEESAKWRFSHIRLQPILEK